MSISGKRDYEMGLMRVFIACRDKNLKLALIMFLDGETDLIVVGLSDRLKGLSTQLNISQPDVLILDWELSAKPMTDLLHDLGDMKCSPRVIVLVADPQKSEAILEAGADFILAKDSSSNKLSSILNDLRSLDLDDQKTNNREITRQTFDYK